MAFLNLMSFRGPGLELRNSQLIRLKLHGLGNLEIIIQYTVSWEHHAEETETIRKDMEVFVTVLNKPS